MDDPLRNAKLTSLTSVRETAVPKVSIVSRCLRVSTLVAWTASTEELDACISTLQAQENARYIQHAYKDHLQVLYVMPIIHKTHESCSVLQRIVTKLPQNVSSVDVHMTCCLKRCVGI